MIFRAAMDSRHAGRTRTTCKSTKFGQNKAYSPNSVPADSRIVLTSETAIRPLHFTPQDMAYLAWISRTATCFLIYRLECTRTSFQRGVLRRLFMGLAVLAALVTGSSIAADKNGLTVVLDDNYPPYIFRDDQGILNGYLVDSWKLWEIKTGIPVKLLASDWVVAQQRMRDGQADVIDTLFKTKERESIYDFSPPYATIPVAIYTQDKIGGIIDTDALRGFLVGVKAGDACIGRLGAEGLHNLQAYASYDALIQAAIKGDVRAFCMDEPPANYLLYRDHADQNFRLAFRLYSGDFHRAVKKGDQATLALLNKGFSAFTPAEERSLREKWMGSPLVSDNQIRLIAYALLAVLLIGGLLMLWVFTLRKMVRQRTDDLSATIQAIPDLLFELDLDGRYHQCHSYTKGLLVAPIEELIGKTVRDVMPAEAASVCLSALRQAHDEGYASGHQIELTVQTGRHWFELSVARKGTQTGADARFILLARNITERKVAEARLKQQSQQLRVISQATREINAELDTPLILRKLVATALDLTGATHGTAGVLREGKMTFGEYNLRGQLIPIEYGFSAGEGIAGQIMATKKHYLCNDAHHDPKAVADFRQAQGFVSLLATPVISRHGELLASFEIYNKSGGFDDTDVQLMTGLADSAAVALENTAILAAQRRVEAELRDSESLKSLVLNSTSNAIIATNSNGLITVFNTGAERMLGYPASELIGLQTPELFHDPEEMERRAQLLSQELGREIKGFDTFVAKALMRDTLDENEWTYIRKDGSRFAGHLSVTTIKDEAGRACGSLGIITDISAHKDSAAVIRRLAHYDLLTNLPNRALLSDRIEFMLGRSKRNDEQFALMFLDLDRFKNVNDSLGHLIGDELLIQFAGRLKSALREEDTISRLGGDEFILLIPETDSDGAARVATKLLELTARPYHIGPHELTCTSSIGVALYPADGDSFETLSMCADTAMYRAKKAGRNTFRFFTNEMQKSSARALQIENALRRALESGELSLVYQPQMSLADNRIIGTEALLRWKHPGLGPLSPAEFIPIAEDSGLILPIGEWVLRTAVRQMRAWLDAGLPIELISVNLSAIQFRQSSLIQNITKILAEENLPAEFLELELTESTAMDNPTAAMAIIDSLHELGIRMAIDDFGTGYSSMSYLKRLRANRLKIDQSFVQDLFSNPEDEAIVTAIISLARILGLRTIAEGVETAEQLAFLRDKGCDEIQGYYFGKPLTAAAFEGFVRAHTP